MAAFLREHMRPFGDVLKESPEFKEFLDLTLGTDRTGDNLWWNDPTEFIHVGHELAYGATSNKLGFNFSFQGDFAAWLNTVLQWVAITTGRRRGLNAMAEVGKAHLKVPYTCYDSSPTPVLPPSIREDWNKQEQEHAVLRGWAVDEHGWRPLQRFRRRQEILDILSKREIICLGALWR